MVTHNELIKAGAPTLPDGLEYKVSTRVPDAWPPREWVYAEIVRTGQTFFQKFLGGARVTRVGTPLGSIVDVDDPDALMRGLVAQCVRAQTHYEECLAHADAARQING